MLNGARVVTQGSYMQRPEEAQACSVTLGQVNQENAPQPCPQANLMEVFSQLALACIKFTKKLTEQLDHIKDNW